MPVRPTSRLDLHLVPPDEGPPAVQAVRALLGRWVAAGWVEPSGGPGPQAEALVRGGFARVRVDDPGQRVLYANQVGGFQVRCPSCGAALARAFRPLGLTPCAGCGGAFDAHGLDCRPPVAVGWASLVVIDAADAGLGALPTGWRLVLRRPG